MSTRTPTRTDLVDAAVRQIELWRATATRGRTASRSFNDYAKEIERLPTKGDVADEVVELIAAWCRDQAAEYATGADRLDRLADGLGRR